MTTRFSDRCLLALAAALALPSAAHANVGLAFSGFAPLGLAMSTASGLPNERVTGAESPTLDGGTRPAASDQGAQPRGMSSNTGMGSGAQPVVQVRRPKVRGQV